MVVSLWNRGFKEERKDKIIGPKKWSYGHYVCIHEIVS